MKKSDVKAEYYGRINRVLDYIEAHIDRDLTLDELAGVSFFSKYHFHRVFSSVMGETLFSFIQRIRIAKAAVLLVEEKETPITGIGFRCGFASSAHFTRSFKAAMGVSPSGWRSCGKDRLVIRAVSGKDDRSARGAVQCDSIAVEIFPEMHVAYVRNVGAYKGDAGLFGTLFGRLCRWAAPRGLISENSVFAAVYHDNPEIIAEEKQRVSVCLDVPPGTKTEGAVGMMTIPGGRYAVASFRLAADGFADAWNYVYGEWMPESGYQPDDRPRFEMFSEEPANGIYPVRICIPVKPA